MRMGCVLLSCFWFASAHATVQISGLQDYNFGNVRPSQGEISIDHNVCVGTTLPSGDYRVTASGEGGAAMDFEISDGIHTLPYRVFWNGTTSTAGNQELTTNVPQLFSGADTKSLTCGDAGGVSANLQIRLNVMGALAGTYSVNNNLALLIEDP